MIDAARRSQPRGQGRRRSLNRSVALETVHEQAEVAIVKHAARTLLRRYGVAFWHPLARRQIFNEAGHERRVGKTAAVYVPQNVCRTRSSGCGERA
jgi:trimethylamine:corrinoid methyltransferase-like protein